MPYDKLADLPDDVKALPKHAQEIWMAAFNAAFEQYDGDEEKAFGTAWAAVKQKYRKEGDRWIAREGEHMDGKWIAVFRTGRHTDSAGNTRDWTKDDLDHMVASYDVADPAPAVIGHPTISAPAYGWVNGIKRQGELLYVRFKQLVPEFVDMLRRGLFKKRSISVYPDGTLRHIGFLGAAAPAVKGLPDVGFKSDEQASTIEYDPFPEDSEFAATEAENAAQKKRSGKYNIAIKEGGNVTKPSDWANVADDDFLDPVNYRYPCLDADQTRAAASYWGKPANQAQYTSQERAIINRRLDAKKKKFNIAQEGKKPQGGSKMSMKQKITSIFSKGLESLPDDDPLLQADEPRTYSEAELKAKADEAAEKARKEEKERIEQEYAEKAKKTRLDAKAGQVKTFVEDLKKKGTVIPAWDKMGLSKFMESLDDEEGHEFAEGSDKISQLAFMRKFLEELPKVVTFKEVATRDEDAEPGSAGEKLSKLTRKKITDNKELTYSQAWNEVQVENPELAEEYAKEVRGEA